LTFLTDTSVTGVFLRRLFPVAILAQFAIGFTIFCCVRSGLFGLKAAIAIFCVSTIIVFSALAWWSAGFLGRSAEGARKTSSKMLENLQRYRLLAEAMPQIIWTSKPDGSMEYNNKRWFEYSGLTIQQTKDQGWVAIMHPDDRQDHIDRWRKSIATGCDYENEFRLKRASDGQYRWHLARETPLRNDQGETVQWFGTCTDIHDQKQAHGELEKSVTERTSELAGSRARLQAVLDAASDVSIVATDPNGLITVFSRGSERMLGYASEELVGKHLPLILHLESEVAARESELTAELGKPVRGIEVFTAKPRTGQREEREWTYLRKDGGTLTVNLIVTASYDADGAITGFVGVAMDVTEQRKTEKQLRDQALILDLANDTILILGKGDRISYWNRGAERLYGWSKEEAVGQVIHNLFKTQFPEPLDVIEAKFLAKGYWEGELVHARRDGTFVTVASSWTLQRDEANHPVSVIEMNYDITARKEAERELAESKERLNAILREAKESAESADRAKSDFLANMSHEIRTPMNGVIGMTGLLLDSGLDGEQRNLAETIRSSGESLLVLVNDILDFSKIEAGKLSFEEVDFDLREVVEDSLEMMAGQAQSKGIELVGDVDFEMATRLRGDPGRVHQILTNLIGNAIKFTASGEVAVRVTVVTSTEKDVLVRLTIKDTGIGISPETRVRLFQPFVQADSSTSRRFGGTGLGLAICKHLAESMNGEIGVESAPGQGSEFWVKLRFLRPVEPEMEQPRIGEFAGAGVLIVDDNETSRQYLHKQIVAWRMRNGCAGTGEEALAILRTAAAGSAPYPVAIIDMQMPDMDGLTLARKINADPLLNATRLIILTPFGKPIPSQELKIAEVDACCAKPIRQSALFDCIVQVLSFRENGRQTVEPEHFAGPLVPPPARIERILLAEDNVVNQLVALGNLRKLGYHADVVINGREVLNALETKPYDVILMDCQMPELDGYEATREIRQRERTGHRTWIIAMTANVMVGDREKCLAAGMDDYISKPVRRAELRTALENRALHLQT
jgi:two-component system sensor histidine kinase/response regulator